MAWEVFEKKAQAYDDWFDRSFGAGAFSLELESIRRLVRKAPPDSLEIGVGTGRFARALDIRFGMDPSRRVVAYAKERGIRTVQAAAESLPFRAASFSSVFMIATVCFLDEPRRAFAEINRILRPEGMLVLGLILRDSKWGNFYERKKTFGNAFYRHANFWKKDALFTVLDKTGFAVTGSLSTLFDPPGLPLIVDRKIREGIHADAGFHAIAARKKCC